MSIYDVAAAIFLGNVLSFAFVWGMNKARHIYDDKDASWMVLAALCLPLVFFVLSAFNGPQDLPFLGALAAQ